MELVKMEQLQNDQLKRKRPRKSTGQDGQLVKAQERAARRTSVYRGVTRHKWTGRYEAHLWDKNCWSQTQNKKGRQVYLGAYDNEEVAARAYDLAALKYWGAAATLNFPLSDYTKDMEEMQGITKEEYLASLRRKSSGFSRGVSKYRGVARHHHNGRWEARIGKIFGNKYLYLGTYGTQEEAAAAYDLAAIEYRGLNAVTNFDMSCYMGQSKQGHAVAQQHTTSLKKVANQVSQHQQPTYNIMNNNDKSQPDLSCCNLPKQARPQSSKPTTALGLLLQSTKFKEMLERASMDQYLVKHSIPIPKPEPDLEEDIGCMDFDFSQGTREDSQTSFTCSSAGYNYPDESSMEADLLQLLPIPADLSFDPFMQWFDN